MKTLVFVTQNKHKVEEIRHLLTKTLNHDDLLRVTGLEEIGCNEEIPETSETLEGNALQKALYVSQHYNFDCFADDTGLEIDALDGRPGVYSSRYAGPQKNFDDNISKVLKELSRVKNRKARFRTIIALVLGKEQFIFEGRVEGRIINERRGSGGFGYDSVFVPDGFEKTFAEMSLDEKNTISHRAEATRKLVEFLRQALNR